MAATRQRFGPNRPRVCRGTKMLDLNKGVNGKLLRYGAVSNRLILVLRTGHSYLLTAASRGSHKKDPFAYTYEKYDSQVGKLSIRRAGK